MKCRTSFATRTVYSDAVRRQKEIEERVGTKISIAQLPQEFRQIATSLAEGYNDGEIA